MKRYLNNSNLNYSCWKKISPSLKPWGSFWFSNLSSPNIFLWMFKHLKLIFPKGEHGGKYPEPNRGENFEKKTQASNVIQKSSWKMKKKHICKYIDILHTYIYIPLHGLKRIMMSYCDAASCQMGTLDVPLKPVPLKRLREQRKGIQVALISSNLVFMEIRSYGKWGHRKWGLSSPWILGLSSP